MMKSGMDGAVRSIGPKLGSQQSVGVDVAGTSARESSPPFARLVIASGTHRDGLAARARKAAAARNKEGHRSAVVESDDRAVSFLLAGIGGRLFIERTHRSLAGTMAVQCLLIGGREEFLRWCEVEPVRFEHPVVFDRLWRYGDEVLDKGD